MALKDLGGVKMKPQWSGDQDMLESGRGNECVIVSAPAFDDSSKFDDDGKPRRAGTFWTASAHVITAVIGSGVLSLAWSIAQMGWVAGPVVLLLFAFVTYYTSSLLADCYRHPDPVTGKRNYTYMDAVKANLGPRQVLLCGVVQYANLLGTSIGYTITAASSMVAITRSDCFHHKGTKGDCHASYIPYMSVFGIMQIILSQIPEFGELWFLSVIAAVMSFLYSTIGLGLGIAKSVENRLGHGTVIGIAVGDPSLGFVTLSNKIWGICSALGNIAFAYSFSMILIEIQDTVKSSPPENQTMKRASLFGIVTTTVFYMSVGCAGYAAFGDNAPGNLLTGFGFYNPYWLVNLGNACVVVHLVGAYQVYTQPLFAFFEYSISSRWPKSNFIHKEYLVKVPWGEPLHFNLFRLVWRSIYVVITTVLSMLLPFFNDVMGLIGAFAFWPLTVYFPMQMFIVQRQVPKWCPQWLWLHALSIACFAVSLAAALGSTEGMISDLKKYKPFQT